MYKLFVLLAIFSAFVYKAYAYDIDDIVDKLMNFEMDKEDTAIMNTNGNDENIVLNVLTCLATGEERVNEVAESKTHLTEFDPLGIFLIGTQHLLCRDTHNDGKGATLPTNKIKDALMLAKINQLAYEDSTHIKSRLANTFFDTNSYGNQAVKINFDEDINNPKTSTEGFIAVETYGKFILIAIRGSETTPDKSTYIDWFKTNLDTGNKILPGGVVVHQGFYNALDSVYNKIVNNLRARPFHSRRNTPLIITGYSLGGALATMLTYRLYAEDQHIWERSNLHLYTFGAPPVGNQHFIDKLKGVQSYNIMNVGDPFSYPRCCLPKKMIEHGYAITPTVYYLPNKVGHQIKKYIEQLESMPKNHNNNPLNSMFNGLLSLFGK